jgi:hypothetical protein
MLLAVRNVGETATAGPITVVDPLPAGLTVAQISGNGWSCGASTAMQVTCVRTAILNAGAAAPIITVTLNVANNAAPVLINTATATTPGDIDPNNGTATAFCRRNPVPAPAASPAALAIGALVLVGVAWFALRRRFS